MQITASEFHAVALPQELRFPPPYAENSPNPADYSYWWQLMRMVFDLPNPSAFPVLRGFTDDEATVVQRYIYCCKELSESTILSHATRVQVNWKKNEAGEQEEVITADFPSREAIRGTTVLFRQLFSTEERASYNAVRKMVGKHIHATVDDFRDQRLEMQKSWNGAHGKLRAHLLTAMADRKVCDARGWKATLPNESIKPEEMIKLFQYGDLIHWGRGAEELSKLSGDEFNKAWNTMHFLTVMAQLSHFYLGYSILARKALGDI
ncbi:hypothetical protein [Streptomyces halstedii]|uniref:hypothetical protein n=1 Tax=Streptomyces halstedii TaxID=1944 RepID=UPI0034611268